MPCVGPTNGLIISRLVGGWVGVARFARCLVLVRLVPRKILRSSWNAFHAAQEELYSPKIRLPGHWIVFSQRWCRGNILCVILLTKCRVVVVFHAPDYMLTFMMICHLNYVFHAKLQLHE